MTRFISFAVALAFAGVLLVGCEGDNKDKQGLPAPPTPPAGTGTKEAKPTTPPAGTPTTPPAGAPTTPPTKTGDVLKDVTGAVQVATTCGLTGCTKPADPKKFVLKDGKPIAFCCDDCLNAYKKANNM